MSKWLDFTMLMLYCGLIYWLSSKESLPVTMLFSFQDKFHHAGAYFVMGLLAWRCARHITQRQIIQLSAAIIFCSFYGATDEWHQSFVPGRNADSLDWLADTIGASLAMLGFYKLRWIGNDIQEPYKQ